MEYPDVITVIEPEIAVKIYSENRLDDRMWVVNRSKGRCAIFRVLVEPLSALPADIREQIDSAQDGFTHLEK